MQCFLIVVPSAFQGAEVLADVARSPKQRADPGQTEAVPRGIQLRDRDRTGNRRRRKRCQFRLFRVQIPLSKHAEVASEKH